MRCFRRDRARSGVLASLLLAAFAPWAVAAPCITQLNVGITHGSGNTPQAVALGDLDGDGRLDAVLANGSANTFTVLKGIAGGGFAAATSIASGVNPRSLTLADLDEDGRLDLLLGTTGGIQHWRGLGNATFTLVATLDAGTSSRSIVAADLNADGVLDVASANAAANEVQVLIANGSNGVPTGGFAVAVRYAVGNSPARLLACDVDGNGALDLVSADNSGGTVSVLRGLTSGGAPNGAFAASVRTTLGGNPSGLAHGDVDSDGRLDLLVTHGGGSTLHVLHGRASGGFTIASYPTPLTARELALADVDGDGIADAIMVCAATNQIAVLPGTSGGGFGAARTWATGSSPTALAVADLNGDLRPDVVVANTGTATLSRFMGGCAANADATLSLLSPVGGEPWWPGLPQRVSWQKGAAVTAVDVELSSDGGVTWQPLATSVPGTTTMVVAPPPISGDARVRVRDRHVRTRMASSPAPFDVCGLLAGPVESPAGLLGATGMIAADFDDDGVLDAALANSTSISVVRGTGGGSFAAWGSVGALAPRALAAADLDRDGRADLLSLEGTRLIIRAGGEMSEGSSQAIELSVSGRGLTIADLDRDGDLDVAIVTGDAGSGSLRVLLGDGAGGLVPGPVQVLSAPGARVLAADLDSDGSIELTLTTSSTLEVWRFVAATWVPVSARLLAAPVGDLAWGDFDRDGRLDLAACLSVTGDVWRFRGNNTLGFDAPSAFHAGNGPAHLSATDWDGDGRTDLVLGSSGAAGVAMLLGDGSAPASAGTFTPVERFGDVATSGAAMLIADLDGDRAPDVLLATADGRIETRPSPCAPQQADTLAWTGPSNSLGSVDPGTEIVLGWTRGPAVSLAAIELSRDGGEHWETLQPASAGSQWRWTVRGPGTSKAMLRVRDAVVQGRRAVSAMFAITGPALEVEAPSSRTLALSAPWPSPTRAGVQLRLSLQTPGDVRAELVDLQGRVIRVLEDGVLAAGGHSIGWDGLDASGCRPHPGVLFVRVAAGGESLTRRVVVMR